MSKHRAARTAHGQREVNTKHEHSTDLRHARARTFKNRRRAFSNPPETALRGFGFHAGRKPCRTRGGNKKPCVLPPSQRRFTLKAGSRPRAVPDGSIRRGHARKRQESGCDGRGWCAGLHDGGQLALGGRVVCAGQAVATSERATDEPLHARASRSGVGLNRKSWCETTHVCGNRLWQCHKRVPSQVES